MAERIIKPVQNNMEKYDTFRKLKGRYRKAINGEFYFEAMAIAYALLEDRLKAFLYYAGAINDRNSFKVTQKKGRVEDLRMVANMYPDDEGNSSLGITAIRGKMRLVRATVLWADNQCGVPESVYLKTIKEQYESCLDPAGLLECMDKIDSFCSYRNEVVHASFNKNISILDSRIRVEVEKVMEAEAFLETQINALKKKNLIRKTMKLGNY